MVLKYSKENNLINPGFGSGLKQTRMKNFIIVHEQQETEEITVKFLINPETGQSVRWEFINN